MIHIISFPVFFLYLKENIVLFKVSFENRKRNQKKEQTKKITKKRENANDFLFSSSLIKEKNNHKIFHFQRTISACQSFHVSSRFFFRKLLFKNEFFFLLLRFFSIFYQHFFCLFCFFCFSKNRFPFGVLLFYLLSFSVFFLFRICC